MIDIVKKFFGGDDEPRDASETGAHHDVRVATCALFVEMAMIDEEFDDAEMRHIVAVLKDKYGVAGGDVEALMTSARQELDDGIDMWRFTNLINQNYSADDKLEVVRLLWELIYADGHLSEHENYLMRKLGRMLKLSHKEIINAKLMVLNDRRES